MATSKGAQMHVGMTPILQNLIEMKKHQNQNQKLFGGSPSRLNTDPGTDNTVHIDKLVSTGLLGIKILPATAVSDWTVNKRKHGIIDITEVTNLFNQGKANSKLRTDISK